MDLCNVVKTSILRMHPNIMDVLFKHKNEIFAKLNDIRGIYYLDHIAIILINPHNEIIIFSITPSVEFNLLAHNLWEFDLSFNPSAYKAHDLLFWNKAYVNPYKNQLLSIKETQHNFQLGFNILRPIDNFNLIYSFATRQQGLESQPYYQELANELLSLGDYSYRQLRHIYTQYSALIPPVIESNAHNKRIKNYLRLIINNE